MYIRCIAGSDREAIFLFRFNQLPEDHEKSAQTLCNIATKFKFTDEQDAVTAQFTAHSEFGSHSTVKASIALFAARHYQVYSIPQTV